MKLTGSIFIIILLFTGCSQKISICPVYPKPSKEVLNSIKSLNNNEVNKWMIEQYKLNKKLGVCNEL